MIVEFGSIPDPTGLQCELCIVGSGPVGLAIALEFAHANQRVIVLESGGDAHEDRSEQLSRFEVAGHRRVQPSAARRRIFGGTSTVWSGRCMPFTSLDLQTRQWIPDSGWPLQVEDFEPWLQRAGSLLGAGPTVSGDRIWPLLGATPPNDPWDPERFETQVFQASVVRHERTRSIPAPRDSESGQFGALAHSSAPQAEDIGESSRSRLVASANIRVLLHAHALDIETDISGMRAEAVNIAAPDGRRGRVRARQIVLACGGIDNARLLLLSRARHPQGLGNEFDQVGRYLSDHHYAAVASIRGNQAPRLRRRMGYHWLDVAGQRHVYLTGVSLSAQRQREEGLPRATLFLFEHGCRPHAMSGARNVGAALRGRGRASAADWKSALLHPVELAQGLSDRYRRHRPSLAPVDLLEVGCNVEQSPDPDSRITLGTARDAFGLPVARIDWRLAEVEYVAYRRSARLFEAECRRLGLEVPVLSPWVLENTADWRGPLHDMAHPMCSTRMAGDPRKGVVDGHCAVHGVQGLHVAGSSVFSTGGTSNPTLMAVTLGLRLAQRLRNSLDSVPDVTTAGPHIVASGESRVRVGIVGAGSRVRQVYLPVLRALADRFEVVGVTSRSAGMREALALQASWPAFASTAEMIGSARPEMLIVAVSTESNVPVLHATLGHGIPLLCETPLAWNERDGRALVARSRGSGVVIGVAEQFPFLPAEQLKRRLIGLGALGKITAAVNDFASYDYHGLAQLRAYLGYDRIPERATAQRMSFGRTGVIDGAEPATPALGWSEDWLLGTLRMSGDAMLVHNYSAGYAVLPSRPRGQLRILGTCGSLVDESACFVDRSTGAIDKRDFERNGAAISVQHPALGTIAWSHRLLGGPLSDDQVAVAQHVEAFGDVVRSGAVPLYSGELALGDVELLRALHYSAQTGGRGVRMPLRPRWEQARVAAFRLRQKLRLPG